MTPNDLLKKYKTQAAIAERFGYTRAAVSQWVKKKKIPARTQRLITAILKDDKVKP